MDTSSTSSSAIGTTVSTRESKGAPVQINSDRAIQRMQSLRRLEEEQRLQDLEDLKMTEEQLSVLERSFESVKIEFADLDGLSWTTPEAHRLLTQWYKKQVLRLRPEDEFGVLLGTTELYAEVDQTGKTIHAPGQSRFPPTTRRRMPPLALPAGLQEHIDAVVTGTLPIEIDTESPKHPPFASRIPPHRVFSLPPRVGPSLNRTATARPLDQSMSTPVPGSMFDPQHHRVVSLPAKVKILSAMARTASIRPGDSATESDDSVISASSELWTYAFGSKGLGRSASSPLVAQRVSSTELKHACLLTQRAGDIRDTSTSSTSHNVHLGPTEGAISFPKPVWH